MSSKKYWVLTRPKRKLILVPDILKVFQSVALGQEWEGNRPLQIEFETALTEAKWKAQNISKSGSGGRTYAALLFMLGLWYEDDDGVKLTIAGEEIVEGNPPVPILTKQLINYQYPSPYSLKTSVNLSSDIKIRPHRFILRLFQENRFKELTQNEVAFCIVPFAKKDTDLKKITKIIAEYRENPEEIERKAEISSETSKDNLKNIGNTYVNQLEYTGFFEEISNKSILTLKNAKEKQLTESLKNARDSFIPNPVDSVTFQKRYGLGLKTQKDYREVSREPMDIKPNDRKILTTYYTIAANSPINAIDQKLINEISAHTGVGTNKIQDVLEKFARKPRLDRFEEKYIQLSKGGTETAKDFEVVTANVFSDQGFGLKSEWIGSKGNVPDVIVYLDHNTRTHGIIDNKAYKQYSASNDHRNRMIKNYIPDFQEIELQGKIYKLVFFSYIAGGFKSTMLKSLEKILQEVNVNGSYITALNFMKLLRLHKQKSLETQQITGLFSSNREITEDLIFEQLDRS
ncbi:hypothetical protein GF357_03455 [Candidatus Dojkabacteria bacterium]|nr:hypothetical protein [Candidatus Dojkabacteria bacterium]